MHSSRQRPDLSPRALRLFGSPAARSDLLTVLMLTAGTAVIAAFIDIAGLLARWSAHTWSWLLGELWALPVVMSIAFGILAIRRMRELGAEVVRRRRGRGPAGRERRSRPGRGRRPGAGRSGRQVVGMVLGDRCRPAPQPGVGAGAGGPRRAGAGARALAAGRSLWSRTTPGCATAPIWSAAAPSRSSSSGSPTPAARSGICSSAAGRSTTGRAS